MGGGGFLRICIYIYTFIEVSEVGFDSCLVSSRQFLHVVTGVARGSLDFVQLFGSTSGFEW